MTYLKLPILLTPLACLFAVLLPAHAAGAGGGVVTTIFPISSGQVFVTTANVQSQPACATPGWVIDLNGTAAVGGKAMLAVLMAAQASGKPVTVVGKGSCDIWADRESIAGVSVAN